MTDEKEELEKAKFKQAVKDALEELYSDAEYDEPLMREAVGIATDTETDYEDDDYMPNTEYGHATETRDSATLYEYETNTDAEKNKTD